MSALSNETDLRTWLLHHKMKNTSYANGNPKVMAKDLSAATQSLLEAKQSKGGLTTERVAKEEKDGKWVSKAGEMQAKSTPGKGAPRKKENPVRTMVRFNPRVQRAGARQLVHGDCE